MDKALAQKVIDRLSSAQYPALFTHLRPDGDAFGSLLGLATPSKTGVRPLPSTSRAA